MLENLIGKGLESEPAEAEEIRRLLKKIDTRLTDANHAGISLESRFDLAYEALLQLAVTALRANHLRVTSRGGHHALAMQTLDSSIGYPREKVGVQGDLFEPMTRAPRGANERRADVRREGIRSMP